jgi:hypothetical protein
MTSETPTPGAAKAGGTGPRILLRHYFSTHLLWTAFHASEKAREIEAAHTGRSTFDIEHHSYVLTAIVSAAGFLEAAINEFFKDAMTSTDLPAMDTWHRFQPGPLMQWRRPGRARTKAQD